MDTPRIERAAAQPAAVLRLRIPQEEMPAVMGPAQRELMEAVAAQGVGPAGPWYAHVFRMSPEECDLEIGVPVSGPFTAVGRVQPGETPAAERVARAVHRGGYEGLPRAWGELDRWVAAEGLTPREDLWDVYVTGPEASPDPSTWRTEIHRPLRDG